MGENAAQTVREIEDTRARLESEFRELEERMPAAAVWTKRAVGVAVGGGIGATALMFGLRRVRSRRKKRRQKEAATQLQAVVQVLPERWAESLGNALSDERWKGWAVMVGGGWLLFKLAELRQLRRLTRSLAVSRAA